MSTGSAPLCYQCKYRGTVPGDAHSCCTNKQAEVRAQPHGVQSGWFMHPINFDPVWLETCSGYSPTVEGSPMPPKVHMRSMTDGEKQMAAAGSILSLFFNA